VSDIRSEEQEQLEAIKYWFKQNAFAILGALLVASGIFYGPDLYKSYKNSKIWPVSDMYTEINAALSQASVAPEITEQQMSVVRELTDSLVQNYPDTHYAFLASLADAGLNVQQGNYSIAKERLEWAVQQAEAVADLQLANYRLALVEAQLGETDAALDRLSGANPQFAPLYAAARGDIYATLGQRDQAISAYEEALVGMAGENSVQSNTVQLKLNGLRTGAGAITQE